MDFPFAVGRRAAQRGEVPRRQHRHAAREPRLRRRRDFRVSGLHSLPEFALDFRLGFADLPLAQIAFPQERDRRDDQPRMLRRGPPPPWRGSRSGDRAGIRGARASRGSPPSPPPGSLGCRLPGGAPPENRSKAGRRTVAAWPSQRHPRRSPGRRSASPGSFAAASRGTVGAPPCGPGPPWPCRDASPPCG